MEKMDWISQLRKEPTVRAAYIMHLCKLRCRIAHHFAESGRYTPKRKERKQDAAEKRAFVYLSLSLCAGL